MKNFYEYLPTSVILPSDYPIKRDFFDNRCHYDKSIFLDDEDYKQHDNDTIFYDIYFSSDQKSIKAVGPPLVNLGSILLPMQVLLRDDTQKNIYEVKTKIRHRDRVVFYEFVIPRKLLGSRSLYIIFNFFSGWTVERVIKLNNFRDVYLQLTTIQKNNPIHWIIDWAKYYEKIGFERIILYDNSSNYYQELKNKLNDLDVNLEIILVPWNFKYGPTRSQYNQFCQAGQNNHTHQCFAKAVWCGFFDIDEYIFTPKYDLISQLKSASRFRALFRINNYIVPNTSTIKDFNDLSVSEFPYRNKYLRDKAYKCIARIKGLVEAKTHNGRVKFGYWRGYISEKKMFFFHFIGLSTRWKPHDDKSNRVEVDKNLHVKDTSVVDLLSEK